VLTLSIHRHEPGFFPGTGGVQDIGFGRGRFHAVNLPLREGVDDAMFTHVFDRIFRRAAHNFRPDVIVVQVGSGSLQVNLIRASFTGFLTGVSHEMDLAFDDGDGAIFLIFLVSRMILSCG
jgi:hypothetical protein